MEIVLNRCESGSDCVPVNARRTFRHCAAGHEYQRADRFAAAIEATGSCRNGICKSTTTTNLSIYVEGVDVPSGRNWRLESHDDVHESHTDGAYRDKYGTVLQLVGRRANVWA
jgi:hypothetical protein